MNKPLPGIAVDSTAAAEARKRLVAEGYSELDVKRAEASIRFTSVEESRNVAVICELWRMALAKDPPPLLLDQLLESKPTPPRPKS